MQLGGDIGVSWHPTPLVDPEAAGPTAEAAEGGSTEPLGNADFVPVEVPEGEPMAMSD